MCDEKLEDINGTFLRERCLQDKGHVNQARYFQGDSLSPLAFCMALNLLSAELQRTGYGYWMSTGCGETAKCQLVSLYFTWMICAAWQKS